MRLHYVKKIFQGFSIAKALLSTDVDLFRIKIWDKDNNDSLVYDNKIGASDDSYADTPISGGNIKVHGTKATPMDEPLPKDTCALAPFPNPINPDVWIPYQLSADSKVVIHIYGMRGASGAQAGLRPQTSRLLHSQRQSRLLGR